MVPLLLSPLKAELEMLCLAMGMFRLEKRRHKGDMTTLLKYFQGYHTDEGQDLFMIIPECRTCNSGLKLQEARL